MKVVLISLILFILQCENKQKTSLIDLPNYFLDSTEYKNNLQEFYLVSKVSGIKLDTILTIKSFEGTAEISSSIETLESDTLFFIKIYNVPVGSIESIIYRPESNQLYKTEIYNSDAIGDYIDMNTTNLINKEIAVISINGNYKIKFDSLALHSII